MASRPATSTRTKPARLEAVYQQVMAQERPFSDFTSLIEELDWSSQPAPLFKQAIDMALALEWPLIARKLAALGAELYPSDERLQKANYVLAPPRVIETDRPPQKGLSEFMVWLRQHAHEYWGQWVAVRNGSLLNAAESREELLSRLGSETLAEDTIISRVG